MWQLDAACNLLRGRKMSNKNVLTTRNGANSFYWCYDEHTKTTILHPDKCQRDDDINIPFLVLLTWCWCCCLFLPFQRSLPASVPSTSVENLTQHFLNKTLRVAAILSTMIMMLMLLHRLQLRLNILNIKKNTHNSNRRIFGHHNKPWYSVFH